MDEPRRLATILASFGEAIVAFSGGVDSTLLLRAAHDVLGDRVEAITAVSPSLAADERTAAATLARAIGAAHRFVETHEMADPGYVRNDGLRCYHCKRELYAVLRAISRERPGATLLYGAIVDDLGDDRPGMQAAAEAGARAPLLEAGMTKAMVRDLSRRLGLPTWDKPAMACLASRIPRGTPVDASLLGRIDAAESAVRRLGYRQVRVRSGGVNARLELDPQDLSRALRAPERRRLADAIRAAGFETVEIDPAGYRTGGARP